MAVTVADLLVKFSSDTREAEQGMARVERRIGGLASGVAGLAQVAGGMVLGTAITAAGRAVAGLGGAALDFEANMANVDSIAQLSSQQLETLKNQVIALARDPAIREGPAQLAAGLYDVYSSGFQGADGLTVLATAAKAATAGITDTATASRAITAVLNAYGLSAAEAGHVSDVLFQTVNEGVITFEELANNLGNTVPIASSLGISIEELGAAYAQMTLKGVGASQAETQIAALMRAALNPTEALTAAVQRHGYTSAAAALEAEGLAGFLRLLNEESGGAKDALFDLLGTQEAMNAATILGADGAQEYADSVERMEAASKGAGATQKALEHQMRSSRYWIGQVKKELGTLVTQGFRLMAPAIAFSARELAGLVGGLTDFSSYLVAVVQDGDRLNDWLTHLPEPLQRSARGFALVVDAVNDLARAFGRGGLQGALDELERMQGDRLLGGLRVLGEEGWRAFLAGLRGAARVGDWTLTVAAPAVAGWLWDHRGDAWGAIKSLAGWTFDQAIDLGAWTLSVGAPAAGGWLARQAGRLGDWIKAKLLGTMQGDATGGPEPMGEVSLVDVAAGWLLNVGVPEAGAWLAEYAGRLADWIEKELGLTDPNASGIEVEVGQVTVKVLRWVSNASAADIQAGIQSRLNYLQQSGEEIQAELREWQLILFPPKVKGADPEDGQSAVERKVRRWGPFEIDMTGDWWSWSLDIKIGPEIKTPGQLIKLMSDSLQYAVRLIKPGDITVRDVAWDIWFKSPTLQNLTESNFAVWLADAVDRLGRIDVFLQEHDWLLNPLTPDFPDDFPNRVHNWLRDHLGEPRISLPDWDLNLDLPDIHLGGVVGALAGPAAWLEKAIAGVLPDSISVPLGPGRWSIDLPRPDFPNLSLTRLEDWIGQAIDGVTATRDALVGMLDGSFDLSLPVPDFPDLSLDKLIEWIADAIRAIAPDGITVPFPVPIHFSIPDWVPFIGGGGGGGRGRGTSAPLGLGGGGLFSGLGVAGSGGAPGWWQNLTGDTGQGGGGGGGLTFTVTFTADTSGVETGLAVAQNVGQTWQDSRYAALFGASIRVVATALTGATAIGQEWARQSFTARFGASITAVGSAYAGALAIGNAWAAKTFTARFDIDTGPLWAALATVRTVAQEISNLLPHSPAKQGPLAEPVTFAHIAEAARRDLAGLPSLLERALALPAPGAFGSRAGFAPAAAPVYNVKVVKILTVPPDEWIRVARDAQQGARFVASLPRELDLLLAEV